MVCGVCGVLFGVFVMCLYVGVHMLFFVRFVSRFLSDFMCVRAIVIVVIIYDYLRHQLVELKRCNPYPLIYEAVIQSQPFAFDVPLFMVYVMCLGRGVWKYGERYYKYLLIDVGVTAENTHLAAVALGLCSVMIGGFRRDLISELLNLERHELPALLLAVGRLC